MIEERNKAFAIPYNLSNMRPQALQYMSFIVNLLLTYKIQCRVGPSTNASLNIHGGLWKLIFSFEYYFCNLNTLYTFTDSKIDCPWSILKMLLLLFLTPKYNKICKSCFK